VTRWESVGKVLEVMEKPLVTRWESVGKVLEFTR